MRKLGSFREFHFQELQDPLKAKAYIDVALETYEIDNDKEALLLALQDVVEAQGGPSDKFSVENLVAFLNGLDWDVDIVIRPKVAEVAHITVATNRSLP